MYGNHLQMSDERVEAVFPLKVVSLLHKVAGILGGYVHPGAGSLVAIYSL